MSCTVIGTVLAVGMTVGLAMSIVVLLPMPTLGGPEEALGVSHAGRVQGSWDRGDPCATEERMVIVGAPSGRSWDIWHREPRQVKKWPELCPDAPGAAFEERSTGATNVNGTLPPPPAPPPAPPPMAPPAPSPPPPCQGRMCP